MCVRAWCHVLRLELPLWGVLALFLGEEKTGFVGVSRVSGGETAQREPTFYEPTRAVSPRDWYWVATVVVAYCMCRSRATYILHHLSNVPRASPASKASELCQQQQEVFAAFQLRHTQPAALGQFEMQ